MRELIRSIQVQSLAVDCTHNPAKAIELRKIQCEINKLSREFRGEIKHAVQLVELQEQINKLS